MLLIILVLILGLSSQMEAQVLVVGFYGDKCSAAESIVKEEVKNAFFKDKGIAPGIVRLHFHDCFVRGCDASVLIDSTPTNSAEKDGPPNGITIRGTEVIDSAKARLEAQCKGVVSCADILAFAARDSIELTGGFRHDVPAGRRDGRVSLASETLDMPAPTFNLDQVTQSFAKKGLTQDEMIALAGAHTIGRAHCTQFTNRLYNFTATTSQDPSLDPVYAEQLKGECPRGPQGNVDQNLVVQMNISPALFENSYYRDVLMRRGLFQSDQSLTTSPEAMGEVRDYAFNELEWQQDFVQAMAKMGQIGVLTGTNGEIRTNCRVINP